MIDLTASYMGLRLRNPLIVASCDLTRDVDDVLRCQEAGAGAVVLKSIFEEEFLVKDALGQSDYQIHPEAVDYLRSRGLLEYAPSKIVKVIEEAKAKAKIPIIASINCQSPQLWPRYAQQLEQAGADGIELNIYFLPVDPEIESSSYEAHHVQILKEVREKVSIPVAVKLTYQFTSLPHLASKLADNGCDGLVLFNWFLEPDIDINNLKTKVIRGKANFYQSLKWIALLAGRIDCELASSGGLNKAEDLVKQILAGASAVQAASLFYQKGLKAIEEIIQGLKAWMREHDFTHIDDFRGELSFKEQELSFKSLGEAEAYFRAQYLKLYKGFE